MSYTTLNYFEKLDYDSPGWNHIYNSNIHKMETLELFKFKNLRDFNAGRAQSGGNWALIQVNTTDVEPTQFQGQEI